jgi:hypothetical protein
MDTRLGLWAQGIVHGVLAAAWLFGGYLFYDQSFWFGAMCLAMPLGAATAFVFAAMPALTAYEPLIGRSDRTTRKIVTRAVSAPYVGILVTQTMTLAGALYYAASLAVVITNPGGAGGSGSAARQLAADVYANDQAYAILLFVFIGATAVLSVITLIMAAVALNAVQRREPTGTTRMQPTTLT